MKPIGDLLRSELSDDNLDQLGRSIGADKDKAREALDSALPELLRQLQANASSRRGRESLESAIERDHDGSIFNRLPQHLENPDGGNGDAILRHIFGSDRNQVAQRLGSNLGIDTGSAMKLLITLAPLLLGMLGKAKGSGGGGLGDLLGGGGGGKSGCLGMLLPLVGKFLGKR
ncbi:MAG TPA: DUF937 domain-containing protein [Planctomycetota bacterium]|nr:DUF937 domain-containing protein [Planctomycetota bacterium]